MTPLTEFLTTITKPTALGKQVADMAEEIRKTREFEEAVAEVLRVQAPARNRI